MAIESVPRLIEPEANPESRERLRLETLDEVTDRGLEEVTKHFNSENTEPEIEALDYHDRKHSERVVKRTEAILRVLQKANEETNPDAITNDDIALAKAAAAWHDVVQESTRNPDGTRKRLRGFYEGDNPALPPGEVGNERRSFNQFWEVMNEYRDDAGEPLFTEEDRSKAELIFAATFPSFGSKEFSPGEQIKYPYRPKEGFRAFQPHLERHLDGVRAGKAKLNYGALAIGLADLSFGDGGDKEFRELQFKTPDDLLSMTDEERGVFAQKIFDWQESQVEFLRMQKVRFKENTSILSEAEQDTLSRIGKKLGRHIREQIERVKTLRSEYTPEKLADREKFLSLAQEVGYKIAA